MTPEDIQTKRQTKKSGNVVILSNEVRSMIFSSKSTECMTKKVLPCFGQINISSVNSIARRSSKQSCKYYRFVFLMKCECSFVLD